MKQKPRLIYIFPLTTASLIMLLILLGTHVQLLNVTAQEPQETPGITTLSEEELSQFGLSSQDVQPTAGDFDLQVIKQANVSQIPSGGMVTFNITIKNNHPTNTVEAVLFYDNYPAQMKNVQYNFGALTAYSNGQAKPTWIILEALSPSESINVTVTGILESGPTATVQNTATVTGFTAGDGDEDTNPNNNSDTASVKIVGTQTIIFLPFIRFDPPPPKILAYFEDFNEGNPWVEFDLDYCKGEDKDGQYWVRIKNDNNRCLPPAQNNDKKPERPYRTYGEFQVTGYHSEGPSDQTDFGLFINGAGSDNYYYFVIRPNASNCTTGGNWRLVRRRNGHETTLRSGNCHPAIRRGTSSAFVNTLKIVHKTNLELSVFVNDQELATFQESSSEHLTGEATGLFVFSEDNDVLVKFDNFTVWKFP